MKSRVRGDEEKAAKVGDNDQNNLDCGKELVFQRMELWQKTGADHHQAGNEHDDHRNNQKLCVARREQIVERQIAQKDDIDGSRKSAGQA